MTGRLDGKVAFVTGAARGQGRSHAVRLAQEGADVIAVDICAPLGSVAYELGSAADLAETLAAVEGLGRKAHGEQADVRNLTELEGALKAGVAALGRLDIVCANAGITSFGATHELTEEQWGEMLGVNLTGVWHTAKAAIPHLLSQGQGGSIILTSSTCGSRAYPNLAHYVAAKHGVIGLMKTMAMELAEHSIRVNCVSPTQVDTPMIMHETAFRLFRPDLDHPTRDDYAPASQSTNTLPIPWVEPADVSAAVAFLASDSARFITGVDLPVDAGCLLR
ncbi:MAG TPA: mycofactocin-coupled SDR family oxidoreductase [Trebonia sp.]|nr:mycofactocin-coupled SDR family oxidoreductase [Trebonia sp.]